MVCVWINENRGPDGGNWEFRKKIFVPSRSRHEELNRDGTSLFALEKQVQ